MAPVGEVAADLPRCTAKHHYIVLDDQTTPKTNGNTLILHLL
jgi:hypothetical protein